MAKLSASGTRVLARVDAKFVGNQQGAEITGGESKFALRSDGVVLKKTPAGKRWTIWKKFKPGVVPRDARPEDAKRKLCQVVVHFGYEVVRVKERV